MSGWKGLFNIFSAHEDPLNIQMSDLGAMLALLGAQRMMIDDLQWRKDLQASATHPSAYVSFSFRAASINVTLGQPD